MTLRIAVIDRDTCKSDKCQHECYYFCPVVRLGQECVKFDDEGQPEIVEDICTGCGICIKKCPFDSIDIVNLPDKLSSDLIHKYGVNGFTLFKLPDLEPGKILGIIGKNGIGKSTAIKILSDKIKANFGNETPQSKEKMLEYTKGNKMNEYFTNLYNKKIRVVIKPQTVYNIPKVVQGQVYDLLEKIDERNNLKETIVDLDLEIASKMNISDLSGGELQRVAIASVGLRDADVYLFDEPSSYNDVFQRIAVAKYLKKLARSGKIVVVVEHDMAILDYLSDLITVVYGDPGVYGIFSRPESVRTGINMFLDGTVPSDNIRFRKNEIKFETVSQLNSIVNDTPILDFTDINKKVNDFSLKIDASTIYQGEIIGILGPNAIGKSTFLNIITGNTHADSGSFNVMTSTHSYKPQHSHIDYPNSVQDYLSETIGQSAFSSYSKSLLLEPLGLTKLLDRKMSELSGGEMHKVAITKCLLTESDLYILDEPSAFVDIEDRLVISSTIKRIMNTMGKTAIIVDHDLLVLDLISNRIMVFEGKPNQSGHALKIKNKKDGFNSFLNSMEITIRRDKHSGRPRINKFDSRLDRQQKASGNYYYEE